MNVTMMAGFYDEHKPRESGFTKVLNTLVNKPLVKRYFLLVFGEIRTVFHGRGDIAVVVPIVDVWCRAFSVRTSAKPD